MTDRPPALRASRLAALLQLASPLLPVGAYAYSQGLERAVHDGHVVDAPGARRWIAELLEGPVAQFELPVWLRLHRAATAGDGPAFAAWNERYLASRETHELRAETLQMGSSLRSLARDLALGRFALADGIEAITFPAAFAATACALGLDEQEGGVAYVWGWLENQVAAALKSVPLGQLAGQRLLLDAHAALDAALATAARLDDDALCSAAPGLALACALHEVQYSRLFRS